MYATYKNETLVIPAPNKLIIDDLVVINPSNEQYESQGYLELKIENPSEDPRKWYEWQRRYEVIEGDPKSYIRGYYIEVKVAKPDYAEEVNNRIRTRYSQADVEAIILNGSDTEEHAEEYATLQAYRAEVKTEVKAEIEEWEQA